MHHNDDQPEPAVSEQGESPSPTGSADSPQSPDAAAFAVAERVVDLPHSERDDALARLAPSPEVARRARELLGATERMGEFLEHSPIEAALQRPDGLPPGAAIGPWRVEALLGSGAMGDVYRARPAAGGDWAVAVKLMRPGVVPRDLRRRFEFEISTLATLHHANIARHIESGLHQSEEGPRPYLAMELVQGRPITEHAREAGLDRRAVIGLFLRACAGVEHAHRSGVIHRDLKPSHLMVEAATGEPKVLDFGVARSLDPAATLSSLPGVHLIGTLPYMSPEQAAGDPQRPVDTRTDVYSMGAVLYELFAGRPPIEAIGRPLADVLEDVRRGEGPRLSSLAPSTRGDIDLIVHAALAADPAERYQSVAALAEDLRRHLRGEPITIRPPRLWETLVASAKRHRARYAAAGMVAVLLAGAVAFGTMQLVRARKAEAKSQQMLFEVVAASQTMLVEGYERLYHAKQPLESKRIVLEATRRQLEAAFERVGDDPILARTLIESLGRLASITGSSGNESMGLQDQAASLIDRAETLARQLVATHDSAAARSSLSRTLELKAFIIELPARPAVFAEAADEAARAAALAAPAERAGHERRELNLRTRYAVTQGDFEALESSVERMRGLAAASPNDANLLDEVGIAERLLGEGLANAGRPGAREALEAARRTLERATQLGNDHYSNRRMIPLIDLQLLRWRTPAEPADVLVADLCTALAASRAAWKESPAGNFARGAHLRSVLVAARVGGLIAPGERGPAEAILACIREELSQLDADPGKATPHADEPSLLADIQRLLAAIEASASGTGPAPVSEPAVR